MVMFLVGQVKVGKSTFLEYVVPRLAANHPLQLEDEVSMFFLNIKCQKLANPANWSEEIMKIIGDFAMSQGLIKERPSTLAGLVGEISKSSRENNFVLFVTYDEAHIIFPFDTAGSFKNFLVPEEAGVYSLVTGSAMMLVFQRLNTYSKSNFGVFDNAKILSLPNHSSDAALSKAEELFAKESTLFQDVKEDVLLAVRESAPKNAAGRIYYFRDLCDAGADINVEDAIKFCEIRHTKYLQEFEAGVKKCLEPSADTTEEDNRKLLRAWLWLLMQGIAPKEPKWWPLSIIWIGQFLDPLCMEVDNAPTEEHHKLWQEFRNVNPNWESFCSNSEAKSDFPEPRYSIAQDGDFSFLLLKYVKPDGQINPEWDEHIKHLGRIHGVRRDSRIDKIKQNTEETKKKSPGRHTWT